MAFFQDALYSEQAIMSDLPLKHREGSSISWQSLCLP